MNGMNSRFNIYSPPQQCPYQPSSQVTQREKNIYLILILHLFSAHIFLNFIVKTTTNHLLGFSKITTLLSISQPEPDVFCLQLSCSQAPSPNPSLSLLVQSVAPRTPTIHHLLNKHLPVCLPAPPLPSRVLCLNPLEPGCCHIKAVSKTRVFHNILCKDLKNPAVSYDRLCSNPLSHALESFPPGPQKLPSGWRLWLRKSTFCLSNFHPFCIFTSHLSSSYLVLHKVSKHQLA